MARRVLPAVLVAASAAAVGELGAQATEPLGLTEDPALSAALREIVVDAWLAGEFDVGSDGVETISFAVTESGAGPRLGGVEASNLIYPASVYKMDVAGRPAIDAMMRRYGWGGSEVTRKFLPRRVEDAGYADAPGTPRMREAAAAVHALMRGRAAASGM